MAPCTAGSLRGREPRRPGPGPNGIDNRDDRIGILYRATHSTKYGTKVRKGEFANIPSLSRLKERVIITRDAEGEMEDVTLEPPWRSLPGTSDPDG